MLQRLVAQAAVSRAALSPGDLGVQNPGRVFIGPAFALLVKLGVRVDQVPDEPVVRAGLFHEDFPVPLQNGGPDDFSALRAKTIYFLGKPDGYILGWGVVRLNLSQIFERNLFLQAANHLSDGHDSILPIYFFYPFYSKK
jgi:hypothetical protein